MIWNITFLQNQSGNKSYRLQNQLFIMFFWLDTPKWRFFPDYCLATHFGHIASFYRRLFLFNESEIKVLRG